MCLGSPEVAPGLRGLPNDLCQPAATVCIAQGLVQPSRPGTGKGDAEGMLDSLGQLQRGRARLERVFGSAEVPGSERYTGEDVGPHVLARGPVKMLRATRIVERRRFESDLVRFLDVTVEIESDGLRGQCDQPGNRIVVRLGDTQQLIGQLEGLVQSRFHHVVCVQAPEYPDEPRIVPKPVAETPGAPVYLGELWRSIALGGGEGRSELGLHRELPPISLLAGLG